MTRSISGGVSRHFDDLDAVLEFDALDDFRQLMWKFPASREFAGNNRTAQAQASGA